MEIIKKYETKAPCKINLHLGVGKSRTDGFHEIQSIFARLSLFDTISISIYDTKGSRINVVGLEAYNIIGEDTLTKAARLWCKETSFKNDINIKIKKNIPTEAGLGGGSSDAAYVLLALQQMNSKYALSFNKLLEIGSQIGSDVSFFLYETTFCYVSGRGEFVEPLCNINFDYKIHLVKPKQGISTKGAFLKLDKINRKGFYDKAEFINNFKKGLCMWKKYFINDFEKVIKSTILIELEKSNNFHLMSGSGSTCYEIIDNNISTRIVNNETELDMIVNFY